MSGQGCPRWLTTRVSRSELLMVHPVSTRRDMPALTQRIRIMWRSCSESWSRSRSYRVMKTAPHGSELWSLLWGWKVSRVQGRYLNLEHTTQGRYLNLVNKVEYSGQNLVDRTQSSSQNLVLMTQGSSQNLELKAQSNDSKG